MTMTENTPAVDPAEAMALSEQAWAAWQKRRLILFGIPLVLLIPGAACAWLRDPQPGETDLLGIGMLVFFGLALVALIWARRQMPLSPPRVRELLGFNAITPMHIERLRRQAGK